LHAAWLQLVFEKLDLGKMNEAAKAFIGKYVISALFAHHRLPRRISSGKFHDVRFCWQMRLLTKILLIRCTA